jgi:UDP-GlcNAc:undecaprenyl-phosphate GlcNAc-1-phosphate transferase
MAIARKFNIIDYPNGTIKKHARPTPYLGGAAIYLGFLMTLGLVFPFDNQFFQFLVGISLLFYIGLIDDLISLRPGQKFMGQFIAVLCFLKAGFYLKAHIFLNIWNIPISILWMLSLVNACNLIDIMDGLAATVALWSSFGFLVIALCMQQYIAALLLASFIGVLGGFLRFNLPPAQIYLGDAGSLFIGGFLSIIPFLFNWGTVGWYGFLVPIIILAIPILELVSLILIRSYKKIPFYCASPDHFAIYLKNNGHTVHQVLWFVTVASIMLFLSSIFFINGLIGEFTLFILGCIFLLSWLYNIFFS